MADARVVHHWDGSLDGVASLWLSKERVPADGTREIWEMGMVVLMAFMGRWWMLGWCIIGTVLWMASLRFGYQKNASQLMAPV